MRVALTIAGSDSGGGAGIQADLKTFHRFGVFGASALTLVTAQNTVGVQALHLLPPDLIRQQITSVARDLPTHAVKTGALGSREAIETVAAALRETRLGPLVVDPVMISKHGDPLLAPDAAVALARRLLPLATIVTPNIPEAEALLEQGPIRDDAGMRQAALALGALGPRAVLIKGGHLRGAEVVDLLWDGEEFHRFSAPRQETRHTHGTGCTLSAAIAAHLALGASVPEAVAAATSFLQRAIAGAPGLGSGFGPVNHHA